MTCDELEAALPDRWAGDLAAAEAAAVDEHLARCTACRTEAADLERLWNAIGDVTEECPSPALAERFRTMLDEAIREEARAVGTVVPFRAISAGWRPLVALAACLLVGIFVGSQLVRRGEAREMAALREEVASLHETVTRSLLAGSSPSARLRGVAYGRDTGQGDPRIIEALLGALRSDPNVNVRLAALEALRPLAVEVDDRGRLIDALEVQDSPLVQVSLVEVLLESERETSRGELERMVEIPSLDPAVKGQLRSRLSREAS